MKYALQLCGVCYCEASTNPRSPNQLKRTFVYFVKDGRLVLSRRGALVTLATRVMVSILWNFWKLRVMTGISLGTRLGIWSEGTFSEPVGAPGILHRSICQK